MRLFLQQQNLACRLNLREKVITQSVQIGHSFSAPSDQQNYSEQGERMCSADRISENVRGVGAGLQADPHLPKGGALPQTSLGLRQRCHVFFRELEFHPMENDQR